MTATGSLPREARVQAMQRVYGATVSPSGLFAFAWPEMLGYLAAAEIGESPPAWPTREGLANRWIERVVRHRWLRAAAEPALAAAARLQRLRIRLRRAPHAEQPTRPGESCRAFLGFGAANEERILAWRDRARPLPTIHLGGLRDGTGTAALMRAAGAAASRTHAALWGEVNGATQRLAAGHRLPGVRPAARARFLRCAEEFLATQATLDGIHERAPIVEIVASSLDPRAFAAVAWATAHGVPTHWVQHGFLALDVLPWLPGATHHAYDDAHGRVASACGAPTCDLAPPIGLAYFPTGRIVPTRTILVASQALLPFDLPIGRGVSAAYALVVTEALRRGWRVVQRPHRVETEGTFPAHRLVGVEVIQGTENLAAQLHRLRPRYLLSVWSTAALDASALGCAPLFVLSREGMREHSVSDLSAYGEILDPAEPTFSSRLTSLLEAAVSDAPDAAPTQARDGGG